MATAGLTCVVRQGLSKFVQPHKPGLVFTKTQKLLARKHVVCPCVSYCTSVIHNSDVTVEYRHGLSVFTVPLPSRRDSCEFVLKPVSNTVKDFIKFLQEEDRGIDRVTVFNQKNSVTIASTLPIPKRQILDPSDLKASADNNFTVDGSRIAGSTTIDILLKTPFRIVINENSYDIAPPAPDIRTPSEDFERFSEVKTLTAKLYSQLNVEEHQLRREGTILKQLEEYNLQIAPLLKQKAEMEQEIYKRNTQGTYFAGFLMGVQFGFLARLTWFEYSWDVMEPVTYFITYSCVICTYGYFLVTSGLDYEYSAAWDRAFLASFYKLARKNGFDIEEYNRLSNLIEQCETDLRRLRDPLQVHLPIRELQ